MSPLHHPPLGPEKWNDPVCHVTIRLAAMCAAVILILGTVLNELAH